MLEQEEQGQSRPMRGKATCRTEREQCAGDGRAMPARVMCDQLRVVWVREHEHQPQLLLVERDLDDQLRHLLEAGLCDPCTVAQAIGVSLAVVR